MPEGTYFSNRLAWASRAQVDPTVSFDLARSPLSDDELQEAAQVLGAQRPASWGMSDVLQDALSREPQRVPVDELRTLQENLLAQGYVNPDTPVDGVWSPTWGSAFRRADEDAYERFSQGNHWLAAPTQDAVRFLGATLPSAVLQGIVGTAKGMVTQAPETLERGGLAGGAAAGATIGAVAGSVIPGAGTVAGGVIGGAVGAAAGFLADFFGGDEEEGDQALTERFLDALTPFEEYRAQGARAFLEDLGFVASAAAMISGAGMAARGVVAGAAGVRGSMVAGSSLRQALISAPRTDPGWFTRLTAAALNRGGASTSSAKWTEFAAKHGLRAQAARPLVRTINAGYTGLSAGQLGARYAAGFGQAEDVYDPTTGQKVKDRPGGAIAEAIEDAPELPSWVDGTVGLILYPEKFFPVGMRGAGKAISQKLGDTTRAPYLHVAQTRRADGSVPSLREARRIVDSALGRDDLERAAADAWLRLDFGIHRRVGEVLHAKAADVSAPNFEKLAQAARFDVVRGVKETPSMSDEILRYSHDEPMVFADYLQGLEGQGSGIERMGAFVQANREAMQLTRQARDGRLKVLIQGGQFRGVPAGADESVLKTRVSSMKATKTKLERQAKKASDPNAALAMKERIRTLTRQINDVTDELASFARPTGEKAPVTLIPVRKFDPAAGIAGTATRQEIEAAASEYERLSTKAEDALKAVEGFAGDPSETAMAARKAYRLAHEELKGYVGELRFRDLIPSRLEAVGLEAKKSKGIVNHLKKKARYHTRGVEVDPAIQQRFDALGYKLVASREDVLFFDEVPQMLELKGVGDYTRRAAFFDTIGLGLKEDLDSSVFSLRAASERTEVGQVLSEEGIKLTGDQALDDLGDFLRKESHPGAVRDDIARVAVGPFQVVRKGDKTKWRMPRFDVRQLTPDDIAEALKLEDRIPRAIAEDGAVTFLGDPEAVAMKVYDALKRGAAFGGEVSVRHPLDSARMLGKAIRAAGLPGFSDWMRTAHLPQARLKRTAVGAAAGAAVGAVTGDDLGDILKGAGAGALLTSQLKGTYAYLPDRLHAANMALRYSLSPVFDASRYVEQNTLGALLADLPPIFRPRNYVTKRAWKSVREGQPISGDNAWREAVDVWDDINGGNLMRALDDNDRRMYARGMLGFSPRHHEAAQAYLLKQRGWDDDAIRETVAKIGRYGRGRTAAEKTINFVVFPFSFQKKFLTSLGDFILQAPARNLLIHEGLRRWNESTADERFAEVVRKYVPLAEEVGRINNFAYGISAGRFFLEGLTDNRSSEGASAQAIASLFVPGGSATPLHQAIGKGADALINLFVPVVVTDATPQEELTQILNAYIPAVRDINEFFGAAGEQIFTVPFEGASSEYQFQAYNDDKRAMKAEWEPLAQSLGYASVDGFLQSDAGSAVAAMLDARESELAARYPTGFRMAQEFTNTSELARQALIEIAAKPDRSEAEDLILKIAEIEQTWMAVGQMMGMTQTQARSLAQGIVRKEARRMSDDRSFQELWSKQFQSTYGPITRVAA